MGELAFMVPLTKQIQEELQREVVGFDVKVVAGDTKLIWDKDNDDETEAAEETFKRLIKKGFAAFSVNKKGDQDKKITKFDSDLEKIIMVPQMAGGRR